MSPKILSLKNAGLTALGLFGFTATVVADPGQSVPAIQASSPAASYSPAVLQMSDGRILQGKVLETDTGYTLQFKGNLLPLRKSQVQKVFASMEELYRSKAAELPEGDPDEQLKLAKWCLTQKMNAEAKTHLQAALAMSPKNALITTMLERLDSQEARTAFRDAELIRTEAVMAPEELPNFPIQRRREMGAPGLPRIFELPTALAVKRAGEFDKFVHPILQKYCARCHNEQYSGEFQLIQIKGKKDRTLEVARVNLDATLRLVNPENPSKSDLLSSTLRPHGSGQHRMPIFLGSNDPAYNCLATWVSRIGSKESAAPGNRGPRNGADGEAFAVDRTPKGTPSPAPAAAQAAGLAGLNPGPDDTPRYKYVEGRGMVFEETPPSEEAFPKPALMGGPRPKLPTAEGSGTAPSGAPGSTRPAGTKPAAPGETPATGEASKTPRTPVKIDPALLERALKNRYK